MATTKRKKPSGKSQKKIDGSKVQVKDLEAGKRRITGGGQIGGFSGSGFAGVVKKST